jgi:enterochelin esterase family protein
MKTVSRSLSVLVLTSTNSLIAADGFQATPDHQEQANVPHGKVIAMPPWTSRIFEGTIRDWWVYVPAQYKPDGSAALMVFQDGHDFVNTKGNWRVPIVFDNLIARGEMPPTIGVFINPGHAAAKGDEFHEIKWKASNRSVEYDTLGDRYARYLVEEILPEVRKQWPFSDDPAMRAIGGASSGGIWLVYRCLGAT